VVPWEGEEKERTANITPNIPRTLRETPAILIAPFLPPKRIKALWKLIPKSIKI